MISQLTRTERQFAIIICTAVTLCGLALFAAAPGDPLAVHGFIVLAFSIGTIFVVLSGYYAPDPAEERLAHYYDDPIKVGIVLAMVWAVFAMFIGVWVRSEEHTSELQSLMRISYAVFCLKKKNNLIIIMHYVL